jgi:hypothetical protein
LSLTHLTANVAETMKTRLQLQGELVKADANVEKVYRNVGDVFRKTWKNEGIRGLQRGLMPAYGYQVLLNGSRLGEFKLWKWRGGRRRAWGCGFVGAIRRIRRAAPRQGWAGIRAQKGELDAQAQAVTVRPLPLHTHTPTV